MWIWLSVVARADEPEGATQPFELTNPIDSVDYCDDCHKGYENSPIDAWEGTMMANAVEDPLFLAALAIANEDIPLIGDLCLRCHTPPGWLAGRCAPGDTSQLVAEDYEGINCDACHRVTQAPEGPLIGNAVYTIVDDGAKRGLYETDLAGHDVAVDPYYETSEMCGLCHEVNNPLFGDFPIERTYSEWKASAFAEPGGQSCQDCHMPAMQGFAAAGYDIPERTIHLHRFVGANTFIPRVLAGERPDLGREAAFQATIDDARALLEDSAIVTVQTTGNLYRGQAGTFEVRVENTTGHKLPSGYPEGRRAWLEVIVTDVDGTVVYHSGAYDPVEARLPDYTADPYLRKYEARLGADGVFSYHMVQQSEILFDGRIPPRGFRATPDIAPVGREFETLPDGTLANWDLAPYEFPVPADATGPLTVTARLWYQTTIREFVEFLRDEDTIDGYGQRAYDLWEKYDRDPPELMEEATAQIMLSDAWVDFGDDDDDEPTGCACSEERTGVGGGALLLALFVARRRRSG